MAASPSVPVSGVGARLVIDVEPNPNLADTGVLERGLFAFEEARLGSPEHAHFAVMLRDEHGQIQGGVDGHVMWHRLFVKTVWLPESLRGLGFGSRLMRAAEDEALRRGCRSIWLTALGDRAQHFYLRLGYSSFGAIVDYVGGQSLYSLQKILE